MAVESSPGFIQANTYSAELLRRSLFSPMLDRGTTIGSTSGGVIGTGADLVITYGGSGLGVVVATGECIVPGSSSATQSGYYLRASSTTSLTPAGSNPSNNRIDLVYAQVQDAAYTGATNLGTIAIATGTPTSGANITPGSGSFLSGAPSVPTSALALGYVQIPAAASTISNSNILSTGPFGAQYAYFQGNIFNQRQTGTGTVTAASGDHVVVSAGSGATTLPAPFPNAHVRVTNYGSGSPTLAQHASEKIYYYGAGSSGANSVTLSGYGATATVESDGTSWYVVAGSIFSLLKTLAVTVQSNGTVTNSFGGTVTVVHNSTGNYTATYPASFYTNVPSVTGGMTLASPVSSSYWLVKTAESASAVTYITAVNGTPTDFAHTLQISGT